MDLKTNTERLSNLAQSQAFIHQLSPTTEQNYLKYCSDQPKENLIKNKTIINIHDKTVICL